MNKGVVIWILVCLWLGDLKIVRTGFSHSELSIKTGTLEGQVQVAFAQWDVHFDEDIYFYLPPPCAAGLVRPEFQLEAVSQDPCFPGCDWTLKGADCGKAANPDCQYICDELIPEYCADQDWIVLNLDEESDILTISPGDLHQFRFQFLDIGQAFRVELIVISGQVSFWGHNKFSTDFGKGLTDE